MACGGVLAGGHADFSERTLQPCHADRDIGKPKLIFAPLVAKTARRLGYVVVDDLARGDTGVLDVGNGFERMDRIIRPRAVDL